MYFNSIRRKTGKTNHHCTKKNMNEKKLQLRSMIYASMLGALTAIGAYIIIPFPIVPITLQTLFVYIAGGLLGGYLGALSQIIYLLIGIIGLPVFSGGKAGFGILIGPTGGYLIGFVIAAFIIGKLIKMKEPSGFLWVIFSMIIGTLIIYLFGVIQLSLIAKLDIMKSLSVGVLPFLIGDTLKIIVAAFIVIRIRDKIDT